MLCPRRREVPGSLLEGPFFLNWRQCLPCQVQSWWAPHWLDCWEQGGVCICLHLSTCGLLCLDLAELARCLAWVPAHLIGSFSDVWFSLALIPGWHHHKNLCVPGIQNPPARKHLELSIFFQLVLCFTLGQCPGMHTCWDKAWASLFPVG